MSVLVDSSVWIAYFRGAIEDQRMDFLIEENLVVINDLILAELIPPLQVRRQKKLITLMREIRCPSLVIEWDDLIQMQIICLRNGINKVGLPDLIVAQHAIQNHLDLFTLDKHFRLMAQHMPLSLY